MNSTTIITKKNEEENYPAHYPSEAFSNNKSICIRNNLLQKGAIGGEMHWTGAQREKRLVMHFSMMQNPHVSCNTSTEEGHLSRHVLTSHLTPTRCLWASPWHVQKGQILPCRVLGSLDHLIKWVGQQADDRWGTNPRMKREMCPIWGTPLQGRKKLGSVYFSSDLFLPPFKRRKHLLQSYPPGISQWSHPIQKRKH